MDKKQSSVEENEMKVVLRSLAVLKLQVKFSLPWVNNGTNLKRFTWKIQEKTLIKRVIQSSQNIFPVSNITQLWGDIHPGGHRPEQHCNTGNTIIHFSQFLNKFFELQTSFL